jgi:hypothetical protein
MYDTMRLNHRRARRWNIRWDALIAAGDITKPCVVTDLSETGARLELIGQVAKGTRIKVTCERFGELHGTVMWCRGLTAGIRFNLAAAEIARILTPIVPGMGRRPAGASAPTVVPRFSFGKKARAA